MITPIATNWTSVRYYCQGPHEAVVLPAIDPAEIEVYWGYDSSAVGARVFISGGTNVTVAFRQAGWEIEDTIVLDSVPPVIDVGPGDILYFTYDDNAPPTVRAVAQ